MPAGMAAGGKSVRVAGHNQTYASGECCSKNMAIVRVWQMEVVD